MRLLTSSIGMRDLWPGFAEPKAQGFEQSLALPHAQDHRELPPQECGQGLAIPQVGGNAALLGWLAQDAPDHFDLLGRQAWRTTRSSAFLQTGQSGATVGTNPILDGARSIAQHVCRLPAGHALRNQQHAVQAVIVAGLVGAADLDLQGQNRQVRLRNGQWLHANMKPRFCSRRNYL